MSSKNGTISINAQNIMPIIKKWLYSDRDIFVRELVSNASDAVIRLKRLSDLGNAPAIDDEFCIKVSVNKEKKTISFSDNGEGMTFEEIEKYINQVAFSGAQEFIEKYKDDSAKSQIIGHFGLGFYSSFMVAERVTIDSLSWREGAEPVLWTSCDGMEFTMDKGTRTERGTTITINVSEEGTDFTEFSLLHTTLSKYCGFISTPLFLCDECGDEPENVRINDVAPLWLKKPSECKKEEYIELYHKLFNDFNDPLFYVHLNADYPFNLKGILYFPRFKEGFGNAEGQVKMFCGQVFVADNVSEVVPEFLLLLKGVIDCPDLPLNVSRSFLQNDEYVKKLSAYITRKAADKLVMLCAGSREEYEGYWKDINPFVKYGCMKDQKFFDKVKSALLFETSEGKMLTLEELKNAVAENDNKVYYSNDTKRQAAAVKLFENNGQTVVILNSVVDLNFISFMEYSSEQLKFLRVDADTDAIKSDEKNVLDREKLERAFKKALDEQNLKLEVETFSDKSLHAMVKYEEQLRRYKEMSRFYGEEFKIPSDKTIVLNAASPLIKWIESADENEDKTLMICRQVSDLAQLMVDSLDEEKMSQFLERSAKILDMMIS